MPLNHQDQLMVLRDILTEHSLDNCGTTSECQQLERLIQSLLTNDAVNADVKQLLQEVYPYSQKGTLSSDLNQHISSHSTQLTQWVENFNSYS